jgi:hypothetical protein
MVAVIEPVLNSNPSGIHDHSLSIARLGDSCSARGIHPRNRTESFLSRTANNRRCALEIADYRYPSDARNARDGLDTYRRKIE